MTKRNEEEYEQSLFNTSTRQAAKYETRRKKGEENGNMFFYNSGPNNEEKAGKKVGDEKEDFLNMSTYGGYQPRTRKEGEIIHTKDGWFQVINGEDYYIEEPPPETIFWDQDNNDGRYGYYYYKGGSWSYPLDTYLDSFKEYSVGDFTVHRSLDTSSFDDMKLRAKIRELADGAIEYLPSRRYSWIKSLVEKFGPKHDIKYKKQEEQE